MGREDRGSAYDAAVRRGRRGTGNHRGLRAGRFRNRAAHIEAQGGERQVGARVSSS